MKVRIEKDELGIKEIPAEAYYGIPDDLKEDMSVFDIVGVMAGASTPKESVDEVVDYLKSVN